MRVGFIGLGSMGGDQARCLAAAKFELSVFDAYPPALERFAAIAKVASSIAEVGRNADIVGVCVRDDQQVRETLEGPNGLLANLQPGSTILIHSTVHPETIHGLAQQAQTLDIDILDAAVSRSRHIGTTGQFVGVMVGGKESVLERARPVLNAYATDIFYAGAQGAGVSLKIINNFVTWTSIVTVAQAFRLATASGVGVDVLHALMTHNGNLTPTTTAFSGLFMGGQPDREFMESQAGIGDKDLQLAAKLASASSIAIPLADQVRAYLRSAMLGE